MSPEPEQQSLYEVRQKIYPRAVHGLFNNWRIALVLFTQIVYYGLPWLTWEGRQAVLFDLGARKFFLFGWVFWPQDFIWLAAILIISALALFLFNRLEPGPLGDLLDLLLCLRHLGLRRLHAGAGLQVHVPLRPLPERDVRR